MKELEEIQSRKVISAYGGSGSIVETLYNGSLLIQPYNDWKCYRDLRKVVEINNPRLLDIVKSSGFDKVDNLVAVPTPDWGEDASTIVYCPRKEDKKKTMGSSYFPDWFYCPRCRRLHKLKDWESSWKLDKKFNKYYPACYHCSTKKKKKDGSDSEYVSRQSLEQVRFALASFDTGKLIDIPFDRLWSLPKSGIAWTLDNETPVGDELYYKSTKGGDGLQSINIYKGNGQGAPHKNMTTIYNKYIVFKNGDDKGAYRVVLRNGTNVYFPNIISCIFIPKPTPKQIKRVKDDYAHGYTPQEIADNTGLSLNQVNEILNAQQRTDPNSDKFGMDEFFYITNPSIYNKKNQRVEHDFWAIRYPNLRNFSINVLFSYWNK